MRKIYGLLLLCPLALAGCVDLPGTLARNQTVKGQLPPEIDPRLPAGARTEDKHKPTMPGEGGQKQTARTDSTVSRQEPLPNTEFNTRLPVTVDAKARFNSPLTADQVTPENAHAAFAVLRQEVDREEGSEVPPGRAPSRGGAPKALH